MFAVIRKEVQVPTQTYIPVYIIFPAPTMLPLEHIWTSSNQLTNTEGKNAFFH